MSHNHITAVFVAVDRDGNALRFQKTISGLARIPRANEYYRVRDNGKNRMFQINRLIWLDDADFPLDTRISLHDLHMCHVEIHMSEVKV